MFVRNAKPLVAVLPKIIHCLIAFPALLWLRSIVSMRGGAEIQSPLPLLIGSLSKVEVGP